MKKVLIILFFLNIISFKAFSIEPDVFVQSTVNRASQILSKDISKEEKINQLKLVAKDTVDIIGVGYYSLGSARKNLDNDRDGVGVNSTTLGCTAPEGYAEELGDCSDNNDAIYPSHDSSIYDELGWMPSKNLDDFLPETIEWYRENLDQYRGFF